MQTEHNIKIELERELEKHKISGGDIESWYMSDWYHNVYLGEGNIYWGYLKSQINEDRGYPGYEGTFNYNPVQDGSIVWTIKIDLKDGRRFELIKSNGAETSKIYPASK